MNAVVHRRDSRAWESASAEPHRRIMGILFERDITPTQNISAGYVLIPPGNEQPKLSRHPGVEEIYYVLRGYGRFILGDEEFDVRPGSAVYVGSGVAHRAINGPQEEMELLWFNSPSAFGPVGGYTDIVASWRDVRGHTHPADAAD
jgi:mannose-6-phosphate isomerase-like protein (cupin superfamily)